MAGFIYTGGNIINKLTTDEAIERLEMINGCKFSEQQLNILKTKNGIKMVACAGSGKTFSLVNLVVKRLMTGEISDANKLLLTTYSKAGAENMTERINDLLSKAGYKDIKVEVRTLHSLYYSILKHFNLIKTILSGGERLTLIRQAVKNCKVSLEEEEIASLDSLFSYQVNNMLSNEGIYKSYVFDLDITLDEYTALLKEFADLKNKENAMDFDDLQLNIFYSLCVQKNNAVIQYLNYLYDYIYVDEFQDTSAIQYKILQSMIKNSENVVFVGDDDQCFVEGTEIKTAYGYKRIEDITVGEQVVCASGHGLSSIGEVESIKKTKFDGNVLKITTESGKEFRCTGNHILFVEDNYNNSNFEVRYTLFGSNTKILKNNNFYYLSQMDKFVKSELKESFIDKSSDKLYELFSYNEKTVSTSKQDNFKRYAKLTNTGIYKYIQACDLEIGMKLCQLESNTFLSDKIVSIEKELYSGYVYDINIKEFRNYIAEGIVVHNCIYSWRGAKADLLLNADVDYHIDKLNLDTNYRCSETILNFARLGIEHMSRREAKDMKSVKNGGEVNFVYMNSKDLYAMSEYTANKIESMIKVDKIAPQDICVLVRYNAHAHILNQMLMLRDIYCNFGDDMKLSYQTIFKDVENIVELCGDNGVSSYDRNACSAVLWKMVKFLSGKNSALMAEFMQNTGCSFTDTLSWILANAFNIGTYTGYAQVNSQIRARVLASFKKLGSDSVYCLEKIYELLTTPNLDNRLLGLLWLYKEGMAFMTKKINKLRNFNCYYKFFETIAKEKGFDEFKSIMAKIKVYENSNLLFLNNSVKLSTIHGSKGLEWKHVILLAYDNISFPDVDYMVSKEDISTVDMQSYIDGERRLAYVGITRAIDTLTIVTDKDNMSLFGLEALGGYNKERYVGSYLDFAKYVKSHGYVTPECMHLPETYTKFKYKRKE